MHMLFNYHKNRPTSFCFLEEPAAKLCNSNIIIKMQFKWTLIVCSINLPICI